MNLFSAVASEMAIDLGTANTCVYARGRGIVLNEPSIVAFNTANGQIEAVGTEAQQMLGRTPPNIKAVRPLKDGVIADFEAAEKMLMHFVKKAHGRRPVLRPRLIIGVPPEITQVERRAVKDSGFRVKASEVHLVDEPMAAAIGSGLPVTDPAGNMIVDIGGGTTDIAVISMAGTVYGRSLRVAGNAFDEAIMVYMRKAFNLLIGERTAEQIKFELASAAPLEEELSMEVRGRHLMEGVPKIVSITDSDVREALSEPLRAIVQAVRDALEKIPPELSADIYDRGIVLTGGGALLRNLDKRLREETGLPVLVAENPLTSVVVGAGKILTDLPLLRKVTSE
jgi:rod shape-determining protein MreB